LVPYIYFIFQLGPLWFKNFNLVSYVYIPSVLSHVANGLHTRRQTQGHQDAWTCVKLNGVNDKTDGNDQLMQTVGTQYTKLKLLKHKGQS
jgi:hypothetical protein